MAQMTIAPENAMMALCAHSMSGIVCQIYATYFSQR
jgi:hypothetical protein